MTRRLLVISHPFPPAGGGGVQRTAKLVKYLPEHGWRATVLTPQAELSRATTGVADDSLLAELSGRAEVVRVDSPEGMALSPAVDRWVRRLVLPDKSRLWNPGALARALWLYARGPFDAVYATGNPYSSYLLARDVARLTRRPYLLDMRDAWRLNRVYRAGNAVSAARVARMERVVLRDAGHVVFATAPMEATYLEHYPALRGRTSTVINGFDDADYPECPNPRPLRGPTDPVTFVSAGTWTRYRRPDPLYAAFARARAADPDFAARARLVLAGRVGLTEAEVAEFRALAHGHGLAPAIDELGYLSHREVVTLQRTADVLVLVTSGLPDEQQGKTTEYLAAGRPVVALVDPGVPAETMIKHAACVELARRGDDEAATRALLAAFRAADARRVPAVLPPPPPQVRAFTRRAAAEAIARILDGLVG